MIHVLSMLHIKIVSKCFVTLLFPFFIGISDKYVQVHITDYVLLNILKAYLVISQSSIVKGWKIFVCCTNNGKCNFNNLLMLKVIPLGKN